MTRLFEEWDIKAPHIPEFTAYELNELERRGRTNKYYERCLKFVKDTVLNDLYDNEYLTEQQIMWLLGIKADLMEAE